MNRSTRIALECVLILSLLGVSLAFHCKPQPTRVSLGASITTRSVAVTTSIPIDWALYSQIAAGIATIFSAIARALAVQPPTPSPSPTSPQPGAS